MAEWQDITALRKAAHGLAKRPRLARFEVNRIGAEGARAIAQSLQGHTSLNLSWNGKEDKTFRVQIGLARAPLLAGFGDIGAVLFSGAQ